MAVPKVEGVFPSGWHMHQSLTKNGRNAFVADSEPGPLSDVGMSYVAGLLQHASRNGAAYDADGQWIQAAAA